jgi:MFS family permease
MGLILLREPDGNIEGVAGKSLNQPQEEKPRFFYGYIVVIAAFIIMVVSSGVYMVFGVFFNSLLDEFGWTRAITSGAYSLSSIVGGVLGIAMGGLTDRIGPRIVVTFCGALLGAGHMLMSQINTIWQLYFFYGIVVGVGMSGLWVPLLSSVARWFVGRRSLMTGIVISGLTFGQMIGPPLISRLIAVHEWRQSYIILGIVVLLCIVPVAQFLKRDPGRLEPYPGKNNAETAEGVPSDIHDYSFKEAVYTSQFWMAFIVLFCFGYGVYAVMVHLVPHGIDLGIPEITAANVLAVNGGIGIIGNFVLGGIIGDRIGNRKVFIIGLVLATVSLVWLVPAGNLWMLYLFAVVFGVALGGIGTSESPLVARLFGLTSHGLIYAVIALGFTVGGAVGPVVTGYIFDVNESYRLAFVLCAALSVVGLILMVMLKPTKKLGMRL